MLCDGKEDISDYKDEINRFKARNRYYHDVIGTSSATQEKIERLFTSDSLCKFICKFLHEVPDEKTYQIGFSIAKSNGIENVSFCNYTTLNHLKVPVLEGVKLGNKVYIALFNDNKDDMYRIDCYVVNSDCEYMFSCDCSRRYFLETIRLGRECCKVEKKSYKAKFEQKHPLKYFIYENDDKINGVIRV